jgi:thioredoxin 1
VVYPQSWWYARLLAYFGCSFTWTTISGVLSSATFVATNSDPKVEVSTEFWRFDYHTIGPVCHLLTPVVKDDMTEYNNQLYVVEVCTDDLPEVAAVAGVVSIPTIKMYVKGQLQDTIFVSCVGTAGSSSFCGQGGGGHARNRPQWR